MKKDKIKEMADDMSLPQASSLDLRGRQSVRATFKLTEKAIEALSIISFHLGIKQKSLFDHLLEDTDTLTLIAEKIKSAAYKPSERVQKTYVLSRKALTCLDKTAKHLDTPRDALVEFSIQRLLPLIAVEREKHGKRKEVLGDLRGYLKEGEGLLKRCRAQLGEGDPVFDRFESAMVALVRAFNDMQAIVQKGEVIESFR